jgi:hypothetical protein
MSVPNGPTALIDPKQLPTIREAPFSERIAQAASERLGLSRAVARLLAGHYLDLAPVPTADGSLYWIGSAIGLGTVGPQAAHTGSGTRTRQ